MTTADTSGPPYVVTGQDFGILTWGPDQGQRGYLVHAKSRSGTAFTIAVALPDYTVANVQRRLTEQAATIDAIHGL